MEFSFKIRELFSDEISVIDKQLSTNERKIQEHIGEVIDAIGEASASAQHLTYPITTMEKFTASNDRIYIKTSGGHQSKVVGFLKVGTKNLFLFDLESHYHELQPLCVLDFYVHESMQRQGCGKQLFDFMLRNENINPHHLAINRPSLKFMAFLGKHYNLKSCIPQINNFVVFINFFQGRKVPRNRRQWRYNDDDDDDDDDYSQKIGATPYSRPYSLEGRGKSQVPSLPNINSRQAENYKSMMNTSQNNSGPLNRRSNTVQSKPDVIRRAPFFVENDDLRQQDGKYLSTEIFDLKLPSSSNSFGKNNWHRMQSSSAGNLNQQKHKKHQDTSWNIFGVSSSSTACHASINPPGDKQQRGTLLW